MSDGWRINDGPMTDADCHRRHISQLWVDGSDSDTALRTGVSCCQTFDDLVAYFAAGGRLGRNGRFAGSCLIHMEGTASDEAAWDAGELLLHPTRIISCVPVSESDFLVELAAELNRACVDGERVTYDEDYGEMRLEYRCEYCDGRGEETDSETIDCHDGDTRCWDCDGLGWMVAK